MGWESSDVVRFNLWPLLQGQTMALVSFLSGGYKFASVLRCIGPVFFIELTKVLEVASFIFLTNFRFLTVHVSYSNNVSGS